MKPIIPAAPEATADTKPQEQQPDNRMEQLAKRERAFRAQQRQFQQQQQQFKAEQEKLKSTPPDTSWKDRLKQDFFGVMNEAGLSHDEITSQLINTSQDTASIRALKAEIAALKTQLPKVMDDVKASQTKAYEQAVKQVARDVKITTNGNEAFEIINSKGQVGQDAVVEYIKATYEEDGILLSANEAAQEVEDFLLEEATALAKLKKVQAKLTPPEVLKNPATKTAPTQKTQTLTQQATTSTPSGKSDAKQRRERAILAMQGLLNK